MPKILISDAMDNIASEILLKNNLEVEIKTNFKPDELNKLCSNSEYEGPIYSGLRNWIGSNEFPSKKLICDLGSSLVPMLENNIKKFRKDKQTLENSQK